MPYPWTNRPCASRYHHLQQSTRGRHMHPLRCVLWLQIPHHHTSVALLKYFSVSLNIRDTATLTHLIPSILSNHDICTSYAAYDDHKHLITTPQLHSSNISPSISTYATRPHSLIPSPQYWLITTYASLTLRTMTTNTSSPHLSCIATIFLRLSQHTWHIHTHSSHPLIIE